MRWIIDSVIEQLKVSEADQQFRSSSFVSGRYFASLSSCFVAVTSVCGQFASFHIFVIILHPYLRKKTSVHTLPRAHALIWLCTHSLL